MVHCLKRKENESYNEIIHTFQPKASGYDNLGRPSVSIPAIHEFSNIIRVSRYSLYSKDTYVAKSSDQVGRRVSDKEIDATDSGVFEKISQAINSAEALVSEAHYLDTTQSQYWTFICPVLVVPDSVLWQVKYSDNGERIEAPQQVSHVSYL